MSKPSLRMGRGISKKPSGTTGAAETNKVVDSTTSLLNSAKIANAGSDFDEKKDNIQLKKFFPLAILPDPNNPRPKWSIDDAWLNRHLLLNHEKQCLVVIDEDEFDPVLRDSPLKYIPTFDELENSPEESSREDYEVLRELAISIATVGQIQPIEVTLRDDDLYVVEGHLRRLACLLARRRVVIGVLNNTLSNKNRREILTRQMAENGRRKNLTASELFEIGCDYISTFENEKELPNNTELARFLGITVRRIGPLIECMRAYPEGNKKVPVELIQCIEQGLVTQRTLADIMAFKQFGRRKKEAEKLLNTGDRKVVSKKGKSSTSTSGFSWKPKQNKVQSLGRLLIERIPELSGKGINKVDDLNDLSQLFKALESVAE